MQDEEEREVEEEGGKEEEEQGRLRGVCALSNLEEKTQTRHRKSKQG